MTLKSSLFHCRFVGPYDRLSESELSEFYDPSFGSRASIVRSVSKLIHTVRDEGDAALRTLARTFDGVELEDLSIPKSLWEIAYSRLSFELREALTFAVSNISRFHRELRPRDVEVDMGKGLRAGRRFTPLARVGAYVPGGTASYPSSVLMSVIPAKIAGVEEIIVVTPPEGHGKPLPNELTMAACFAVGADRLMVSGGVGAIAALAFGTESVPSVQKIVGPGNVYVDEAKRQVRDYVAIDLPAGPSEVLILADETASPSWIAAELIAQAEHDPRARAVLLTLDVRHIERVREELSLQIDTLERAEVIRESLESRGALLSVSSFEEAAHVMDRFAPEHLDLWIKDSREKLGVIRSAGSVFLGPKSTVAFGDYVSGPNHVLPTGGQARVYSGLSVETFGRFSTYQEVDERAASRLAMPTATLARAEGLEGHARAAELRSICGTSPKSESSSKGSSKGSKVAPRMNFQGWKSYDPEREGCEFDLSDNTSRFGSAPHAISHLKSMGSVSVNRYPSADARSLKREVAEYLNVEPDCVVTGCGSDDLIDSVCRAFMNPGDSLVYSNPTFSMVPVFARMNDVRAVGIDWAENLRPDFEAMSRSGAKMAYIARPNNPCGQSDGREALERFCNGFQGIVVIDEAYVEFSGDSLVEWVNDLDHIVFLRTFSKAWGLAGLRVGYAAGSKDIIEAMEKARGPYKVNRPAEEATALALRLDRSWLLDRVELARSVGREWRKGVESLGLNPLHSLANFLLIPMPQGSTAIDVTERLVKRGFGVRPFIDLPHIGDAIRVTIGPLPWLSPFLDSLGEALR